MRHAPLFPVPCMDAPMPRAQGCAGAATHGYILLLVQEKVSKENDTPDGATTPAHPRFRAPALILRGILPRRSGADILSARPSGRSPGTLRCAGAPYGDPRKTTHLKPVLPLPSVIGSPWGAIQADR